ncbi:MAG: endonuclease domain-containing protein [Rhizobiales bacterium]|nr:endonuclease domain-containing protein [Hyphomicrobiales bacterium]
MVDEPKRPVWHVRATTRDNARRLRRDSTDAERLIWKELRAHHLDGISFRRQTPVGPFIVDFVCHAAGLVIEIDGGQHYEAPGRAADAARDAYLKAKDFDILRFSNADVLTNLPGVLETILLFVRKKNPLPTSTASGGGEEGGDKS